MSTLTIAVDPGKKGGIAARKNGGEATAYKMPDTTIGLVNLIETLCINVPIPGRCAYVENVGFHQHGNAAQASVKLAKQVGELHGVLAAFRFKIVTVNPAKWEHAFIGAPPPAPKPADYGGVKKKVEAAKRRFRTTRKNMIKNKAQQLFPELRVTLHISDALGMLMVCTGALNVPKPCTMRESLTNRKRYAKAKTKIPGQAKRN